MTYTESSNIGFEFEGGIYAEKMKFLIIFDQVKDSAVV